MVKNAADTEQVQEASRKERFRREDELADIAEILSTPSGRRFYRRLLGHCKTFESIWHPSALIHHNAGRQDVGHFLLAEATEANPQAFVLMMSSQTESNDV